MAFNCRPVFTKLDLIKEPRLSDCGFLDSPFVSLFHEKRGSDSGVLLSYITHNMYIHGTFVTTYFHSGQQSLSDMTVFPF